MGWLSGLLPPYFSWIPAVVLFVFLLPLAPYELWKREKRRWEKEHAHVEELEGERIPRFALTPSVHRQEKYQAAEHLMRAELKVKNTSPSKSLYGVEVRATTYIVVQERQNIPGAYLLMDNYDFVGFKSSQVYWSQRDASPKQLRIDIPPGSERVSLIAFSDDSNGPPGILNAPVWQKLHLGGKLEIEVTSPDSAAWKGAFYIECHPNYWSGEKATFEFVPWERWAAIHPVTPLSALDSEEPGSRGAS